MPLYEYAWPACKTEFERLRSMADGEAAPCPDCGTSAVRTLSLVAVAVRGESMAGEVASSAAACACGAAVRCS